MSADEQFVEQSLNALGIELSPDEVQMLVALNPGFREMVRRLYAVEEATEEEPELLFRAETSWATCDQSGGKSE